MAEIRGFRDPRFATLEEVLAASLNTGEDLGAGVAITLEGELVAHLYGGWQDRRREEPWAEDTLPCVYSSGKAVAAMLIARAVDEGLLDYEAPVAEVWPEFGAAGKQDITVAMALSHQGGLCGLTEEMSPATWLDWDEICARIAAQAPLWEPGTACGYHPQTYGFIAGELLRRVTGRTIGTILREDYFDADGIDIHCGLTEESFLRSVKMSKPTSAPDLGEINQYTKIAFLSPWASTAKVDPKEWASAEIPASNMHASASGLARLLAPYANDGALEGKPFIRNTTVDVATRERIRGDDLVLPFNLSWAAGVMRNNNRAYGPIENTLGHSGFGGSCVLADPDNHLTIAYVMNKMSPALVGDPRAIRLIEAVYGAL